MDIENVTEFFKWMTVINVSMLFLSSIVIMLSNKWVTNIHSSLFGISKPNIAVCLYAYLGFYKVLVIVFNIVPYCALLLIK